MKVSVELHAVAILPQGNYPRYTLNGRLDVLTGKKNLLCLLEIQAWFICCPASCLVTVTTVLFRLWRKVVKIVSHIKLWKLKQEMRAYTEVSASWLRPPSGTQGVELRVTDKINIWYITAHTTYHIAGKTILNDKLGRAEMEKAVVYFQTLPEYRLAGLHQIERNYQWWNTNCD